MQLTAWLLDAYPVQTGMRVWLVADDGRRLSAVEAWRPTAYLKGPRGEADKVVRWLAFQGARAELAPAQRTDLMTGAAWDVLALKVGDAERFLPLMTAAIRQFPALEFFNADLLPERYWFFEMSRHPLARVEAEIEGDALRGMRCLDSIWDVDYELPPLAILGLKLESDGPAANPAHDGWGGGRRRLEIHLDGDVRVLDGDDPKELLERLGTILRDADPDVIATEYGDAWLMPKLAELEARYGSVLPWSRDPARGTRTARSRSYFTYGSIVHRDATWCLSGRIHLDQRNSFALGTSGFTGLFETARLGRLPLQTAARTSVGTAISSMQVARAIQDGVLVPVEKRVTEIFKSADELLTVDKGGLIFLPEPGAHEGVGELDFASMYPTIMVTHNLSQETFGCACCREDGERVPELGLRVCRRRPGLIPRTLAPLLAKRAACKVLKKNGATPAIRERAAALSTAHKWMLVCCFGYLGYKNARFGRIEAHEATNAWGREALLTAKETAEGLGYRMLHAIVDSLWVVRRDGRPPATGEYEALAKAVEAATGLPVSYEGTYRWLAFLPSKQDARRGVAQRYVGAFDTGEVKARGIEARRVDAPPFIAALQHELLAALARARGLAEARAVAAELAARVREVEGELRHGRMRPADLVIWRHLSQDPRAYRRPTPVATAAHQLLARGVTLEAGEKIGYVLTEDGPRALQVLEEGAPYDAEAYAKQLRVAAGTILGSFGWTAERLRATETLVNAAPEQLSLDGVGDAV